MYYCSVNGQPQQQIAPSDRGLAYGDGMFTTAKIVNGQIEYLSEHLTRLEQGCGYLAISFERDKLCNEIIDVVTNYDLAVLKIIITAGSGGRGYSRIGVSHAQTIVSIHPMPTHYQHWAEQGIALENSEQQLGINPMLKGLKHLNRLEQVLLRSELDQRQCDDLLVCDINNEIVETSCANVFWLRDNQLYTPAICGAGVAGIYRQLIMAQDDDVIETHATLSALENVDAMFICNSVMGIVPVRTYQNKSLDISQVVKYRRQFLLACSSKKESFE